MQRIPIVTPQEANLLLRYFTGVIEVLAKRFELGFCPDEEHLTSLLCELLDDQGASLHSLPYTAADLNNDLAELGSLLHASFALETTEYNKHQERHFTQSDLGIILDYRNHVDSSQSFRKGLLVQAKRLFPDSNGEYRLSSIYKSFDQEQHDRLTKLRDYYFRRKHDIGEDDENRDDRMMRRMHEEEGCYNAFLYLLYNPRFAVLSKWERESVLHDQLCKESGSIFDYTNGLCLYEVLKEPNGVKSALEVSSLFVDISIAHSLAEKSASSGRSKATLAPFNLSEVTNAVNIREKSFPWYLVFQFMLGHTGCDLPEFLQLVSGSSSGMAKELQIAQPRFVLHVTLTAGTNPKDEDSQKSKF